MNGCPKGEKSQLSKLKKLTTEWNTDNGYTEYNTNDKVKIANSIPPKSNQRIFSRSDPVLPPLSTIFPNGDRLKRAILKHCKPTGKPIIVMDHNRPIKNHAAALNKPPQINQIKLPNKLIVFTPPFHLILSL